MSGDAQAAIGIFTALGIVALFMTVLITRYYHIENRRQREHELVKDRQDRLLKDQGEALALESKTLDLELARVHNRTMELQIEMVKAHETLSD